MAPLLVTKTNCSYCNEPVEISYTRAEFEKECGKISEIPYGLERLKQLLFITNVCCESCCERGIGEDTDLNELNRDYWENYYISNPRD